MNEVSFPVVEIFDSIDGEGKRTGQLATFIRLAGCNIRCSYCDTPYALMKDDGEMMPMGKIIEAVEKIGNKNITITGGEPLSVQKVSDLIFELSENGYEVNIETNGTLDIMPFLNKKNIFVTMDYKTASSGMRDQMKMSNIQSLRKKDVLKIVCKEKDFDEIEDMLRRCKPIAKVYISPIYREIDAEKLVGFIKKLRDDGIALESVQMQVQLHKIVWRPEERGV